MKFDKPDLNTKLATGVDFDNRHALARQIPEALSRTGGDYVKKGKVKFQTVHSSVSGGAELTGSVQCGFGIVHHPSLTVVRQRDNLLVERYHCGCREGSRENFCAHCAALVEAAYGDLDARLPEEHPESGESDLKGIRIRLGTHRKSGEPIYWTPEDAERLQTPNAVVIGGADTGNTQVMKSIALQFLRQREGASGETGILIFDWMGDYDESKTDFMESTGARVRRLQKLPLDPFSLRRLERKPQLHVHTAMSFADTLARAYQLGPLQKSMLVQSVMAAYAAKGITSDPVTWNLPAPTFTDVYEEYWSRPQAQRSDALSAVMESLASFELFDPAPPERTTLFDMFQGVVVIDMSGYPRELQSFAAGIMLEQLYAQMCGTARALSGQVRKLLLIDEVDALLAMGSPGLEGILRRSREYGLAVVMAALSTTHFCNRDFDWWTVIRTWIIHNAEDLFKPELEALLKLDPHDTAVERLYQTVKHQRKLESLICIGSEEPVPAEDLAFYEIVKDQNQSYLKETHQETRMLLPEGMPLLDLNALECLDDMPAGPMENL